MRQSATTGQNALASASDGAVAPRAGFLGWDFSSRLLAVAVTLALVAVLDDWNLWVGFVISFGFAHYLLSFWYARGRIGALARDRNLWVPVFGLGILLGLVIFLRFPLEIYFGIHHACNEAYLRRYHDRDGAAPGSLAAARGLFHLLAYLCILRGDPHLAQVPEAALWTGLALTGGVLAHQSWCAAREAGMGAGEALRDSLVEWLVLAAVAVSLLVKITFLQLVLYHFVLWTIVPVPMIRRRGRGPLLEYGLLTAGALLLFLALATLQLFGDRANLAFWYAQFLLWSYIHITTSFALSSAHPAWITNVFRLSSVPSRS